MVFDFNVYSSLLLIFFVHTIIYGILFLVRYKRLSQPSSLWLGLFLLLAGFYIAPWMLGYANWYAHQPFRDVMFYVPFQQLFLLGPFIFFYVSSLFNPRFRLTGRMWLHLAPAALYLIYCAIVFIYDKVIVHEYYFLQSQQDPDFDAWYQTAGYISMIVYFFASIRYYNSYKRSIEAVISNSANFLFGWVRNFLVACLLILIAWLSFKIIGLFIPVTNGISWWYFFGFAICCYYIAIAGYSNAVEARHFFKTGFFSFGEGIHLISPIPTLLTEAEKFEVIHFESTKDEQDYSEWKSKIETRIVEDRLFEKSDLTLFDIARLLNTNVSFLSRVINRSFQSNFNDLINGYRVNAFKECIRKDQQLQETLLSIAYSCGFNSKATFNRAFKKHTGLTPQQYIKQTGLAVKSEDLRP